MDTSSIPGLELMQIADVVAREKSIEREEVIMAMEEAIQKAGRSKYGNDRDIRAMIDRKTGSIQLERWTEVVDKVEDDSTQMSGAEGEKHGLTIGDFLRQPLPPIEFSKWSNKINSILPSKSVFTKPFFISTSPLFCINNSIIYIFVFGFYSHFLLKI